MKKGFYAILAALAVFALVMTACPTDEGTKTTTPTTPTNSNTTLSAIRLATGAETSPRASSATLPPAEMAIVKLSELEKTDAMISLTLGSQFKGTAKLARVAKGGTAVTEASFTITYSASSKPTLTFADEDELYVQMTASDGTTVRYYGFTVLIGVDSSLAEEGGILFHAAIPVDTLGTPEEKDAANGVVSNTDETAALTKLAAYAASSSELGKMQFTVGQPTGGFLTQFFGTDPAVTIQYQQVGTGATPGSTWKNDLTGDETNGSALQVGETGKPGTHNIYGQYLTFTENDSIYVKVISGNKKAASYYRILIVPKKTLELKYGAPANLTINAGAATDPVWSDANAPWQYITRANPAEGAEYYKMNPKFQTHGRAKLLWDEDGIWVYMQVWENHVSDVTGDHTVSSVELFILEDPDNSASGNNGKQVTADNNNGGQYRLGANGELTGSNNDKIAAFKALNKTNVVKLNTMPTSFLNDPNLGGVAGTTSVTNGYVLVMQAPWRYPDTYQLAADKKISIEIQINATGDGSNKGTVTNGVFEEDDPVTKLADKTRIGVLNWNNMSSNSYGSSKDYGEAILKGFPTGGIGALGPRITTQPVGAKINVGDDNLPTLSTLGASIDSGTITYQWYKAADLTSAGTPIATTANTTANTKDLALSRAEVPDVLGDYYFYATITNTKGSTGVTQRVRYTDRVKIEVADPNAIAKTTELVKEDNPLYDDDLGGLLVANPGNYQTILSLPFARDLADYESLEIRYVAYTDAGNLVPGSIPADATKTDIYIAVFGSNGTQVGSTVYNATSLLMNGANYLGVSFDLAAFATATGGGSAKIDLKHKNDTNSNPAVTNFLITSVLLVAKPLVLDLSAEYAGSWASDPDGGVRVPAPTIDSTAGTISWTFAASTNDQRVAIPLSPEQITRISDIDVKSVTLVVTATNTTPANQYRFYIANPTLGSGWNITLGSGNNANAAFSSIMGNQQNLSFANRANIAADKTTFLLRSGTNAAADTVVISKIAIYLNY